MTDQHVVYMSTIRISRFDRSLYPRNIANIDLFSTRRPQIKQSQIQQQLMKTRSYVDVILRVSISIVISWSEVTRGVKSCVTNVRTRCLYRR